MDRLISYAVTMLVVATLAATIGLGWDRRPAWGVHIPVLGFRVNFDLPKSLAQQRDEAWARALLAETSASTLRAALEGQSRAVSALKADSDARLARSAKAVQAARIVAQRNRRAAAEILAAAPGDADLCKAADRLILEVVR